MTDDERLGHVTKLERMVRSFKIVNNGSGLVMGGFGRLGHGVTEADRITNLERAASEFRLTGDGLHVAGSLDSGYIVHRIPTEATTVSTPRTCFNIAVSATVSGNAFLIGAPCAVCSPISVSASIAGPGTAFCCDSGDPVFGGCTDCGCVFNDQSTPATIGVCGGLCSSGNFHTYIELDLVGSDYELFVRGTCAANFGDPPTCAGTCIIGTDSGNTYPLGSDPTGTHTIDFSGSDTGADYHFEITIT